MLVIAGLLWLETSRPAYQDATVLGYGFNPGFFPRILIGIWAALAVLLVLRALPRWRVPIDRPDWHGVAGVVVITAGYVALMREIGFLFASMAFALALMLVLGYRQWLVVLPVALLFPLVTWYTFVFLLQIQLPTSPWFVRL